MLSFLITSYSQKDKQDTLLKTSVLNGLKFRSIGPAFASGRVADFAVNPNNKSEWYVGFASSGIWKTTNNGQTFKPIFDNYGAYSIGCLAIDPTNPNVIWAGTGENNHQRALGYGDGVYKSLDGGKSWKNMGLKKSFQIGMIAINPQNTDIVYVAAEGSAWGEGGDRGLYKTTDGGKTWTKVLEISEYTGVNNVILDPRNPDIIYATSEQRQRKQYGKIGGGPESRVYKSEDGGENWRKLTNGLPNCDIGGMGIAISPVNPDVLYLIIEAEGDKGGFFRSTDRGESWTKMSSYSTSGQYFNEIYCAPQDVNKVYCLETVSKYTTDGGKTWKNMGLSERHVDDHALWLDPANPRHFIIGGDGGVYITYDGGQNYYHVGNLPVIQYYRVKTDKQKPFYWVYGGTQDNNSHAGPNQTFCSKGIPNSEWKVTVGGDGFWSVADPENPNIIYAEYQYGNLYKYDKTTGERIYIKPFPKADELTYKWNWDAPFLISKFNHKRLYLAANKVFRSDDGGMSWTEISDDLTAKLDRASFKFMGKYWASDAVVRDVSTSLYGTIVAMAESPVKEGLLFVGTDDGLIQVCENANSDNPQWQKAGKFPQVPEHTFVSDIFPSNFDENVVFATFNNEKSNDFKPYILKSTDKGKTWKIITNGLPDNSPVYTIAQDFKDPDLLFCGTEFGFYTSVDGGKNWIKMSAGLPTIAVRDIDLQKDENDIAIATFGRSFYILDDYSPLRNINEDFLQNNDAYLFDVPNAKLFMQTGGLYGQGATYYYGQNPAFGATFTYYLKEVPKTKKQQRKEKEKELFDKGEYIPQLTWRELEDESKEIEPYLIFTIVDANNKPVRKLTAKPQQGINRVTWNLHFASVEPVDEIEEVDIFANKSAPLMVAPGKYKVKFGIVVRGEYKDLSDFKEFEVQPVTNLNLTEAERQDYQAFQLEVMDMARILYGTTKYYNNLYQKLNALKQAALTTPQVDFDVITQINNTIATLDTIKYKLYGPSAKASWEEVPPQKMPVEVRLEAVFQGHWEATHSITQTEKDNLEIVKQEFGEIYNAIKQIGEETIPQIQTKLKNAKSPYTPDVLPNY